jgi:hypothetical protein
LRTKFAESDGVLAIQFRQKHRRRPADMLAIVTLAPLNEAPPRRGVARLLAFLPRQGRQPVRAADEIRGVRRQDPRGILDIADVGIDRRLV